MPGHISQACVGGRVAGGDNDAPMVLSRWEDVPNGTALFTA